MVHEMWRQCSNDVATAAAAVFVVVVFVVVVVVVVSLHRLR